MSSRRRIPRTGLVLLFVALSGCDFEGEKDAMPIEMNTCTSSATCEPGSACRDSLCVADNADDLKIVLQVTPLRIADGSLPLPIVLPRFTVSEPIERVFELPDQARLRGKVLAQGAPIEANVTWTPTETLAGIAPRTVTTAVTTTSTEGFEVKLLSGVNYRMVVQPTDMRLSPHSEEIVGGDDGKRDVDFDVFETREQALTITGAAADRDLLVTAFDKERGEPISSTATVVKGKAMLMFAQATESTPFWLQIRATESFDAEPAVDAMQCDTDTPAFPSFSIDGDDVIGDDWAIELPKLPQRIRYEGTVELCPEEQGNEQSVTALAVTLHSQSLLLDDKTKLRASFDATTSATYDKEAKALRFCVQVMEGEYNVLATPPASMRCALFAERVEIEAPPKGKEAVSGPLLSLPPTAYLAGTVQTSALMPLASASVEARALGRSEAAVDLPADDRSVTRYNRSSETLTDDEGGFRLPVDLGSYDVAIKPLVESGFPWQVRTDVGVGLGAREAPFSTIIDMASPVVVTGSLRYPRSGEAAQATLGGAEVEAFALIPEGDSGERAVAIGKTLADADGRFMLLLPLSVDGGW